MALKLFSSESESLSIPTAFNSGFSEVSGPATAVNVNVAGKIGKRATVTPIVQLTDQGALDAARSIASEAVALTNAQAERQRDVLGEAFDFGRDAAARAAATLEASARSQSETFGRALGYAGDLALAQADFSRSVYGDALNAVGRVVAEQQAQTEPADQRVQSIARLALIAGAAVVAAIGLAFVARGARA